MPSTGAYDIELSWTMDLFGNPQKLHSVSIDGVDDANTLVMYDRFQNYVAGAQFYVDLDVVSGSISA